MLPLAVEVPWDDNGGYVFAAYSVFVVLVLISRNPAWIRINMPGALGKPFYPGA